MLSRIQPITHAGHACLQLTTRHGTAIVALHGAHLLSWIPAGQREVFWLSPASKPEPAAIRGGVPICWPWFGRQGLPEGAMQHGPVRNRPWQVITVHADDSEQVSITLSPCPTMPADAPALQHPPHLQVALHIDLGETLVQTLQTHNTHATEPFALTQALHSYFAVHDATHVRVTGLEDLRYEDKLLGAKGVVQHGSFQLDTACDRIYQQGTPAPAHHYTLVDAALQRRIHMRTQGSQSVVVWNPGAEQARSIADIADGTWSGFLCIEATNAGLDVVTLPPGGQHSLVQSLTVQAL